MVLFHVEAAGGRWDTSVLDAADAIVSTKMSAK